MAESSLRAAANGRGAERILPLPSAVRGFSFDSDIWLISFA